MLGLGADRLRADMNRLLALLFHQGVLDEQFLQLQQLQDESSPNFVSEVVNIYFHESEKLLRNLRGLLMDRECSDYKKMGIHLNQFIGSSSSIGAKRVRNMLESFGAAGARVLLPQEQVARTVPGLKLADASRLEHWHLHPWIFRMVVNPLFGTKVTFAYNTLIRTHASSSPSLALTLFSNMRRAGVSPDHFTFPFALKACSRLQMGQDLHSLIVKLGFDTNIYVQNALINLYGCCGLVDVAFKVFDEMLARDLVSWSSMIASLADNGLAQEALALFQKMQLDGNVKPDEVVMLSVVSAISNLGCGSVDDSIRVFDKMPERNVLTWTALISGLAVHGRCREALRGFYEMRETNLRPDHITFSGVLVACSHGGLVDDGWKVFKSIKTDYGIEPTVEHYGCMVDLLGRAGKLHEAFEFIERMPYKPNAIIWRTLLGACVNHNSLALAEEAKEKSIS
ncbi:hypothetical protein GH714_038793 [Hevea brasiliensis]|uniref:Uncharacterized protein n=1 Tax=Hevea brasiliensis TaxID=3981 RepID=A0A6A6L0G2_HEVBR|nr:hypothetical protein GH714_038793 [Hevea brasiliensis]